MNHIWNDSLGIWQAVQECARGRGKTRSKRLRSLALAIGAPFALHCVHAANLPTSGTIAAGNGSIHQSGSSLTINQGSGKLAIDRQGFSIGEGNSVTFNQASASAVALNRVLGPDASVIQGALNANGQVFLFNPNGVLPGVWLKVEYAL
jgi:filamentous hemagglutinin family protein